ncbi:MAG TPA: NAD(P)/FAD-dependent oxidoreductase [Thermoleophilaceae bacterium]|nr:NAD(P)/FAD-dependent oxidoreductase [Thermoleophilaceae bacterium]
MERVHVLVVGAGLSGICMAVKLREAGIDDFAVIDRADEVGGTWRDNTYPGCACDVPSALYSFSFEPKSDWSRFYAGQPEIRAYAHTVAQRHGVVPHLRLGVDMHEAAWDDDGQVWRVSTSAGDYEARVLIAATGPWHEPVIPDLPGLDRFEGVTFHSSRWNHDHDLRGRRVAVVGNGASAVQFVPEIQPDVERLHVFQRTPHWVLPKPDRPVTGVERALFARFPAIQRGLRSAIYYGSELAGRAMRRAGPMRHLQRVGERHLRRSVPDPELRRRLTPDYTLGCKRILFSNEYYRSLTQPNVDVIPSAVAEVRERSVVDADGIEREVDTIVFGTGFRLLDMPIAQLVRGRDGRTMADGWQGSPRGYLGTTVAGFPNAFLLLGPNIGNGHSSATVLMEYQARYVVDALRTMDRLGLGSVEVKPDVQHAFNARVDELLAGSIWNAGGCGSYYLDRNGRNSFMYPWSTVHLRRRMRRFDVDSYRGRPPAPAVA